MFTDIGETVFNVNRRNNQFLYSNSNINKAITPVAYELTEIAELIKNKLMVML